MKIFISTVLLIVGGMFAVVSAQTNTADLISTAFEHADTTQAQSTQVPPSSVRIHQMKSMPVYAGDQVIGTFQSALINRMTNAFVGVVCMKSTYVMSGDCKTIQLTQFSIADGIKISVIPAAWAQSKAIPPKVRFDYYSINPDMLFYDVTKVTTEQYRAALKKFNELDADNDGYLPVIQQERTTDISVKPYDVDGDRQLDRSEFALFMADSELNHLVAAN